MCLSSSSIHNTNVLLHTIDRRLFKLHSTREAEVAAIILYITALNSHALKRLHIQRLGLRTQGIECDITQHTLLSEAVFFQS
jgi:hypothetical protein